MQARRRNIVVGAPAATPASGGMPGWQIVLLTVSIVLLAAALAVALYLIRARRQRVTAACQDGPSSRDRWSLESWTGEVEESSS